jgi:hypothetical protein
VVAQEIAASLKGSQDSGSGKQGHHSLFAGSWGVAGFADGGVVGDASPWEVSGGRIRFKGFADGGEAGRPSPFIVEGGHIRFPGFASGGEVGPAGFSAGSTISFPEFSLPPLAGVAPPEIGDIPVGTSPWADVPHLGSVDLRSDHGSARVVGPSDVLEQLTRAARDSVGARTGKMPGWYYGK